MKDRGGSAIVGLGQWRWLSVATISWPVRLVPWVGGIYVHTFRRHCFAHQVAIIRAMCGGTLCEVREVEMGSVCGRGRQRETEGG